jgi:sodium-dependent dicarboxylate transporter 2/3/5
MQEPQGQDIATPVHPGNAGSAEPRATLSAGEQRFDRLRQQAGFVLAPALFLIIWFVPLPGLSEPAHRLAAVLGAVMVLWVTEAIPLPVTALLGPAICVVAGIAPARDIFKSFADPIIFLFLGSFLLAEAIFHHGLNRRIAFQILGLKAVGESPARLLLAFGCITCVLSMWISNTTTTAMMFPVGVSILSEMARRLSLQTGREVRHTDLKFGSGLMLMTAFAATVGGFATPVGTAPNLIGIGMIERSTGLEIHFFKWMVFGLPLALALLAFLVFYLNRVSPVEPGLMGGNADWIAAEKIRLGPLSRGEKNVIVIFSLTVTLWLLPGAFALMAGSQSPAYRWMNARLPEAMVALLGGVLLFIVPVNFARREFTLSWAEAKRIDWGTILLFGGGMAMGDLMFSTGLAKWVGDGLVAATNAKSVWGLTILFAILSTVVTQVTSNTASATMSVPVAIAVAEAAGVSPLEPALAACLGAGMGCMLPVSTPPNAIVYGSGCIPLLKMVRHGFALNVAGVVLIILLTSWLVPLLF